MTSSYRSASRSARRCGGARVRNWRRVRRESTDALAAGRCPGGRSRIDRQHDGSRPRIACSGADRARRDGVGGGAGGGPYLGDIASPSRDPASDFGERPMIRTLLRSFGRGPRRHLAAAAMALLVLGIVASALAPMSRPRHPARRPPATASSPQTSGPERRGTSSLSRAEIARARKVAIRFLQGYLPFVYGRGSAGFVPAAAPALRRRLTRASRRGDAGRAPAPSACAFAGGCWAGAAGRARDGVDCGRRDHELRAADHAEGGTVRLARERASAAGDRSRCRSSPAGAATRILIVAAAAVPLLLARRRGDDLGADRAELLGRRRWGRSLTGRAARHPGELSRRSTSRSALATGFRGRSWPGSARRSAITGDIPDPSCTPQPGATGPGVANFAGASGPMQIGIGGAARR